jgi:putative inorganic carbon (hco3(-)) transporter
VANLAASKAQPPATPLREKGSVAYYALCLFSVFYFVRPEDFIPGMDLLPVGKILGAIGLLGLVVGVRSRNRAAKWPLELKLLLALFVWECLTIPFAYWRGGALSTVVNTCSKTVIIAFLVTLAVQSFAQLKRLLWIQALAVAVTAVASVLFVHGGSRLAGIIGGVFSNPNDLAINIALNWPLCLMFLLLTRSVWKKALWATALIFMLRAIMLTYSRSGFLAVTVAMVLCFWEFGVRGKRPYLIGGAVALLLLAVAVLPKNYSARLVSIVGVESSDSMDYGSASERKGLLLKSLAVTISRPLFGLGPGNFGADTVSRDTCPGLPQRAESPPGQPVRGCGDQAGFRGFVGRPDCLCCGRFFCQYGLPALSVLHGRVYRGVVPYRVGS